MDMLSKLEDVDEHDQIFSALIARDVTKAEIDAHPEALAAQAKEWLKLWEQKLWDASIIRSWN